MSSKTTKLYIGNIAEDCKVDQLCQLFAKYGRVDECDIVKNYGFVHMSSDEETKNAIKALNGFEFMGNKLSVEVSHSKVRPKPGMGGKSQCYRCGKSGHWSKECPRNIGERARYTYRYNNRHSPYGRPNSRMFYNSCSGPLPPSPLPPPVQPDPRDHYDRLDYYRDYIDTYERRPPFPDYPYDTRGPPDYYHRREIPEPYYDNYYSDHRIRDRFNPYPDDRPYPSCYPPIRRPDHMY